MGSTKVQGRGPRTVGAVMPEIDTNRRGLQAVKVTWVTVVEHEVTLPAATWEQLGGAEGPTGEGPVDDFLTDIEADGGQVVERNVSCVESGFEL